MRDILFVRDDGPDDGEPILMLHSLFFDSRMFDDVIALMRASGGGAGRRYLRPDHLGQGLSGGHGDPDLTMDRLAETTVAWLERNQIGAVHLVGSSMGGYVAQRIALDRPDLVASCTLLGASARPEPELARFLTLAEALETRGPDQLVDDLAWTMFGDDFLADPQRPPLTLWRQRFARREPSVAAALRGVALRAGVLDRMSGLAVPLLLICGEQDHAKPPWHMREVAERRPGSRLRELPGVGHTPAVERPDAVAEELTAWIDAHPRRRTHPRPPRPSLLLPT
jgi:3-oxoadipate enol-lactonase